MRQGKDGMEIGNRQDLGFARLKPSLPGGRLALGAVAVAARVIGDALCATAIALLHMATEIGGSAVKQVVDDFVLMGPKRVLALIVCDMLPKDIGHFDGRFLRRGAAALLGVSCLSHRHPPFPHRFGPEDRTNRVGS